MKNENTKQATHTQGEWTVAQRSNKRTPLEIRTVEKCEGAQQGVSICKLTEIDAEANAKRIVKCVNMHNELVKSLEIMATRLANMIDEKEGKPVEDDEVGHAFNLIKQAEQE